MILHIVAIRDIKANVFAQPYFVASIGGAIRSFGDECSRAAPDNIMYNHPHDFELYKIGTYDDNNGKIEQAAEHQQLAFGGNYTASNKET